MTETSETPALKQTLIRRIDKIMRHCEHLIAGGLLIFAVMVIIIDIILRATVSYAIPWAGEATRYAIIWLVFVAGSIGARNGAHISIDFLAETLSPRAAVRIARTGAAVSAFTCIFLTWFGVQLALQMRAFGQTSPSLEWPMWIIYLSVPIGTTLMGLRFLQSALDISEKKNARNTVALSAA